MKISLIATRERFEVRIVIGFGLIVMVAKMLSQHLS